MTRNIIFGGVLTTLFTGLAILSFFYTPYDIQSLDIPNKLHPPNGANWLIAILITAIFGASAINAIIAIGIFNIPVFARLSRGAAFPIWERDFILAARVSGKSSFRISIEHILPNITNLMIVQGTIQFSLGILAEAALSYIGLGAQPPTASWGRMLADAQTLTSIAPHTALIPGLAIVLMVLGLNLLGDGLRDWLDPRLRRGRV